MLTKGILLLLLASFFTILMLNITWEELKPVLIATAIMLGLSGYVMLLEWLNKEINK